MADVDRLVLQMKERLTTEEIQRVCDEMRGYHNHITKPNIKKVIFNNPATVILWSDGTKSVVKCQNGDAFEEEKGFVLAYLKKALGNDNTFNKEIHKWVRKENNNGKE